MVARELLQSVVAKVFCVVARVLLSGFYGVMCVC